jgi:hypothetical protein
MIRILNFNREHDPDPFYRGRRGRVTEIGTRDIVVSKDFIDRCCFDVGY